jgi:hydroxymethylbilane synthase
MTTTLRIATRGSKLALWQAEHIRERLCALDPALHVDLVVVKTRGDLIVDRPLSEVGGKGLFIKEVEEALLDGRADLAVHSLKDLTSDVPAELTLGAIPERADARDALVVRPGVAAQAVEDLPDGARVGTSSLRRLSQLKARRPDLVIVPLRGNVDTRLAKLDAGEMEAIVLACAGLQRLGLGGRITAVLSVEESLPAIGQGALAIECRTADSAVRERLTALEHRSTRLAVEAERAFLAALHGDCKTPMAAHAIVEGEHLRLIGMLANPDGTNPRRGEREGAATDGPTLGRSLAAELQ